MLILEKEEFIRQYDIYHKIIFVAIVWIFVVIVCNYLNFSG